MLNLLDEVVKQPASCPVVSVCAIAQPRYQSVPLPGARRIVEVVHAAALPALLHLAIMLRVASGDRVVDVTAACAAAAAPRRLRARGLATAGPGWPAGPGSASRDGCRTSAGAGLPAG